MPTKTEGPRVNGVMSKRTNSGKLVHKWIVPRPKVPKPTGGRGRI